MHFINELMLREEHMLDVGVFRSWCSTPRSREACWVAVMIFFFYVNPNR